MRKYAGCAAAIVSVAILIPACRSKPASDHRGTAAPPEPVASQGNQQAVRLSGCVELSGMASYILQRVHVEDRDGQDPHRTTNHPGGLVEGSWVRLSGSRDLRALAGHRVIVSGVLVDPDQRAVGTGGVSGVVLPSGDVSRASTNEFHWTKVRKEAGPIARSSIAAGAGPEIQITEIKDLGEACHEASAGNR